MKTAIGFLIFLLIFLSLAACNKQEDLASKIKRLEYEAQKGKSDSQYELGRLYLHGKSIEKDLEKAAFWFSKACAQDNTDQILVCSHDLLFLHLGARRKARRDDRYHPDSGSRVRYCNGSS